MTFIIYKITHNQNGKVYIGQTRGISAEEALKHRWWSHCYDAERKDSNAKFARAIRKYGTNCWTTEVIEEVDEVELLNEREVHWVSHYDSYNKGYNSTTGGLQGTHLSEQQRKQIGDLHRTAFWWNNGTINVKVAEDPGEGWVRGQLKSKTPGAWWTDGKVNRRGECPGDGWSPGRVFEPTEETRRSYASAKGKTWWNNGTSELLAKECLDGWKSGRLRSSVKKRLQTLFGDKKAA